MQTRRVLDHALFRRSSTLRTPLLKTAIPTPVALAAGVANSRLAPMATTVVPGATMRAPERVR